MERNYNFDGKRSSIYSTGPLSSHRIRRIKEMSTIGNIEIKGNETIGKALSANDLEVPLNQRPYRWEEKHVKELFADIAEAMRVPNQEYFLGSIVVIKTEGSGRPQVVDGQQRLATITIFLAAMRDYFDAQGDTDRASKLHDQYLMQGGMRSTDVQPKFILGRTDRDYFEKRVLRS